MIEHKYASILRAIADGEEIELFFMDRWQVATPDQALAGIASGDFPLLRIKPKVININGHEVPAPYRGEMKRGQEYFVVSLSSSVGRSTFMWHGDNYDHIAMKHGLVHLTEDAAEIHAKALLSFTEVKE